jgi:hypothetical protein
MCPENAITVKNNLSKLGDQLFDDAILSLSEGLKCWEKGEKGEINQYKFAVLNILRSFELALKYIVWILHPLLIYKRPYEQDLMKAFTINPVEAFHILINNEIESYDIFQRDITDNNELSPLTKLKKIRNSLEHLPEGLDFSNEDVKETIREDMVYFLETIEKFSYSNRAYFFDRLDHEGAELISKFMDIYVTD